MGTKAIHWAGFILGALMLGVGLLLAFSSIATFPNGVLVWAVPLGGIFLIGLTLFVERPHH